MKFDEVDNGPKKSELNLRKLGLGMGLWLRWGSRLWLAHLRLANNDMWRDGGMRCSSVLFFSRPRYEGWPHHGITFIVNGEFSYRRVTARI